MLRVPLAALLGWIIPGAGHYLLGYRKHAVIALVVITGTFWSGVAIGSVQGTVAPNARKLWYLAQLGTGGNTLLATVLHRVADPASFASATQSTSAHWLSAEVGVHYTGVAGLLNLLLIIDAIVRADPSYRLQPSRRPIDEAGP